MVAGLRTLPGEFRWVSTLALMALLATITAFVAGARVGIPTTEIYFGYIASVWNVVPAIALLCLLAYIVVCAVRRVEHPLASLRSFLADRMGSLDRSAGTIGPILLMPLLMGAFGTLKQMLPLVSPFGWDNALAKVGPMLLGGFHGWQVTHYIFGSPIATMILDRIYTGWILVLFLAVVVVALFAAPHRRAQFFLAFGAGWLLLGVITAYFFPSVGPCFSAALGNHAAADYAPLMGRLHAIDAAGYRLDALHWQAVLWKAETHHHYGFALGVSAMPSMHNAISFLYVLAAARSGPVMRMISWLFALAILIGSVHLGWHYLIDGLTGWAGMALIWWGAGAFLAWSGYQPASDRQLVSQSALPEIEARRLLAA
ncbi:MAG: phosphatase PAP2 family protein [Sphingomicrobium sp.]